jgi:hypothetical protein
MTSAEHFARDISMQMRGIHVLSWDNKSDLVRALLILRTALPNFPDSPTVVPTDETALRRFGLHLFEAADQPVSMRIFLVLQASSDIVGSWLNGWRRRLADPPGTLVVTRHADLMALYRSAPDLMSFAQSEIHEATGLLPLVTKQTLEQLSNALPAGWQEPLNSLPGSMPSKKDLTRWLKELRSGLE